MNPRTPRPRSGVAGVTRLAPHPRSPVVPVALTQGTLALDLDTHPGLPLAPELHVVTGNRGDVEAWAARFAQAVVEVVGGDRQSAPADPLHLAGRPCRPAPADGGAQPRGCSRASVPPAARSGAQRARVPAVPGQRRGQRARAPRAAFARDRCPDRAVRRPLDVHGPRVRLRSAARACRLAGRTARGAVAALVLLARPAGAERVAADPRVGVVGVGHRLPTHLGLAVLAGSGVGEVGRRLRRVEPLGGDVRRVRGRGGECGQRALRRGRWRRRPG